VAERQRGEEALLLLRGLAVVAGVVGDAGFEIVEGGVVELILGFGFGLGDRVHGYGPLVWLGGPFRYAGMGAVGKFYFCSNAAISTTKHCRGYGGRTDRRVFANFSVQCWISNTIPVKISPNRHRTGIDMLLRFSCENVFCFDEEATLSLVATADKRHPNHIRLPTRSGAPPVLRAAGIYGANGHGKTKLVDAVLFLKRMASGDEEAQIESLRHFRMKSSSKDQPSRFVANFRVGSADYEYGLVTNSSYIEQEWLFETEFRQEVMLFTRERTNDKSKEKYSYEFGAKLKDSESPSTQFSMRSYLNFLSLETKEHQTFLGIAADREISRLNNPCKWFRQTLQVVKADATYSHLHLHAHEDSEFLDYLSTSLSTCDTGIKNLKIKSNDISEDLLDKLSAVLDEEEMSQIKSMKDGEILSVASSEGPSKIVRKDGSNYKFIELAAVHSGGDIEPEFELDEESSGTRRLLDLFPMLYSVKKHDMVFVVDELDRKLHPLLAYELVEKFLCQQQGQLIFTTHTTHLLDLDLLRRDEVWLVQKKATGSAELYSLSDFKIRPDLDVRKGYLQGRFGGIPFLGDPQNLGWC